MKLSNKETTEIRRNRLYEAMLAQLFRELRELERKIKDTQEKLMWEHRRDIRGLDKPKEKG